MAGWLAGWAIRIVVLLLLISAAAYTVDWAVWSVRQHAGAGYGSVKVSRFVVAQLKGNKVEYYPDGSGEERCSHALFGQGGVSACWWMARHPVVFE